MPKRSRRRRGKARRTRTRRRQDDLVVESAAQPTEKSKGEADAEMREEHQEEGPDVLAFAIRIAGFAPLVLLLAILATARSLPTAYTAMVPANSRQADRYPHTMRRTRSNHRPADKHKGPIHMEHVCAANRSHSNGLGRIQNYRGKYGRPYCYDNSCPFDCTCGMGRMVEHQDTLGLDFRPVPEGDHFHLGFLDCCIDSLQPVSERELHQRLVSHSTRDSCCNCNCRLRPLALDEASQEVRADSVRLDPFKGSRQITSG